MEGEKPACTRVVSWSKTDPALPLAPTSRAMSHDTCPTHPADHEEVEGHCQGFSTDLADYFLTRRQFINRVGMGMGALALPHLLDPRELVAAPANTTPAKGPLAPRAPQDRKSTRLNSSHTDISRMPSSA